MMSTPICTIYSIPVPFPPDTGVPNGADFHGGAAGYFASAAAQNPAIGVAKEVVMTVGNAVTLSLHIENYGNVPLTNLSLVDDLDLTFGAGNYTVSSAPVLTHPASHLHPATQSGLHRGGWTDL